MISGFVLLFGLGLVVFGSVKIRQAKKTLAAMDYILDQALAGRLIHASYRDTQDDRIVEKLKRFIASQTIQKQQIEAIQQNSQELISNIAHQTKTPITNISLFSQLMEETTEVGELREYVGEIQRQSEKLNRLIEDLMKTAYLENSLIATTPRENNYQELIEAVQLSYAGPAQQKHIRLTSRGDSDCLGFFDERWTKEALGNLVDNGIKYGAVNSELMIIFKRGESFDSLSVCNQGQAIKEAEQGRIFQRFYRGAENKTIEGLGIGLYLVREIIQLQDGFVKVESQEGTNIFTLFLPRKSVTSERI